MTLFLYTCVYISINIDILIYIHVHTYILLFIHVCLKIMLSSFMLGSKEYIYFLEALNRFCMNVHLQCSNTVQFSYSTIMQ